MPPQQVRPIALCVFSYRGRILVSESHDSLKSQHFYRPVGGGIQFGESSATAVTREVREELKAEVVNLRLIGTLENIFSYNGVPGHEIVMVYDGKFSDGSLYELASIPGVESNGALFVAKWHNLNEFSSQMPLYPSGLLEMLKTSAIHHAA